MATSKRQEQVVVEHALAARGDEVGWAPPVASPEVVQMIFRMKYTSMDMDNLTSGFSLSLMVGTNDPQTGGICERQAVFTMVTGGAIAPDMEQLGRLVDNAPKMANNLVALLTILRAYSILLDIVLGPNHVFAVAYRNFVQCWDQQAQQSINGHFNTTEIPALMPLIQRRLQLKNQYWLNQVPLSAAGRLPQLPDYDKILRDVALRRWSNFQAIPPLYTVQPALPLQTYCRSTMVDLPPVAHAPPPLVIPPPAPAPPVKFPYRPSHGHESGHVWNPWVWAQLWTLSPERGRSDARAPAAGQRTGVSRARWPCQHARCQARWNTYCSPSRTQVDWF
jgi:lysophospholipase L1-like esterase